MDPLHLAHLILVAVWTGFATSETILELGANDDDARRHAAVLHRKLDLLVELPLVLLIAATGGALLVRVQAPSGLLWLKAACGLVAVTVTLVSVAAVVARARHTDNPELLKLWSWRIRVTGVGFPFFLAAWYLGLAYFRG